MTKLLSFYKSNLSDKLHTILIVLFLFLLGSHFLDYHIYIFLVFALFLIQWNHLFSKNILLVTLFIVSIYLTWIFLDYRLLNQFDLALGVFSHGILILFMYFLGFSINTKQKYGVQVSDKNIFYLLFIFVISYSFFVLLSYFTIQQDTPLTSLGMYVCFPNPYKLSNVNGGHLISTILTYYLTLMTFVLPFIIFYFHKFKTQGFYTVELILLLALSLFVLYITAIMGRRTVFILFILVFLFLFFMRIVEYIQDHKNSKKLLFFILTIGIFFYGIYSFNKQIKKPIQIQGIIVSSDFIIPIVESPEKFMETIDDIPIVQKLMYQGLSDHRFEWWSTALNVMMTYPFGGGNGVYIAPGIRLAHNTWIDIGKDLGVLPFILFLLITLLHIYYLMFIFFSKKVEALLKYQLTIVAIGIFAIMMIEPVFTSDKTFFAYIFFYFGIISRLHSVINHAKNEELSMEDIVHLKKRI